MLALFVPHTMVQYSGMAPCCPLEDVTLYKSCCQYYFVSLPLVSGADGFTTDTDQDEVRKIERQLKNRFPIGSHVSEQRVIQDFLKQVCV